MKSIAIYIEGGGNSKHQKSALRIGFNGLFNEQKQAARAKGLGWKLVPCGGRQRTYEAFINSIKKSNGETLCVLLVDSEDELPPEETTDVEESEDDRQNRELKNARTRRDHLVSRDNWKFNNIPPDRIHLMVRCMESWIVADKAALQSYYGNDFHVNQLPNRTNFEDEPKDQVCNKLKKATKDTSKGEYAKIKHASELLALIDTNKISSRCQRFATFTIWLSKQIAGA